MFVLVLLMLGAFGASLQAALEPVDPLVGSWLWYQGHPITIRADGTVHSDDSGGTWQYLHNPEVQRHYRIVWEHGIYIDEVVLTEDGQRARVRNQNGIQYSVRRALDDKPAASPADVPSTKTTAAAKPMDAHDPIIGEWRWPDGSKVTLKADRTVTSSNGGQGTWEFLHNPEANRQYRLDWDHGAYIDHLSYNRAAQTGHVVDKKGNEYDVTQWSAASGKPANYFGNAGG